MESHDPAPWSGHSGDRSPSPLSRMLASDFPSEFPAESQGWRDGPQATPITEIVQCPIGLVAYPATLAGPASWPADQIPNGTAYSFDFSSLYGKEQEGTPGSQSGSSPVDDSLLVSSRSVSSGVSFEIHPSKRLVPRVPSTLEGRLQEGEFIVDIYVPRKHTEEPKTRPVTTREDVDFPLVKITTISEASIPSKWTINEICQACPTITKTRLDIGGYQLDATGVPCYSPGCKRKDTFLVETVSYRKLYSVLVSCPEDVDGLFDRKGRGRRQWLRNCSDCSRHEEPRASHAVSYSQSKGGLRITAARCRDHHEEHGHTVDRVISDRRSRQPSKRAPRPPRPNAPPSRPPPLSVLRSKE